MCFISSKRTSAVSLEQLRHTLMESSHNYLYLFAPVLMTSEPEVQHMLLCFGCKLDTEESRHGRGTSRVSECSGVVVALCLNGL